MAETLTDKLLRTHLAGGSLEAGDEVQLRPDQVLLEDYTGTMACRNSSAPLGAPRLARSSIAHCAPMLPTLPIVERSHASHTFRRRA